MAGIAGLIGVVAASATKAQTKILETFKESQRINGSWEGADHEAFREAYSSLHKESQNINEKYRTIDRKVRSLQSSIEAAERDKAEKKA